ncbi:MAG: hypothetical protein H0T53_04645 [Herpetosiphonaceae bacterium]|nr:hypothetical protein [Herpetosiphonaceae bacterium]
MRRIFKVFPFILGVWLLGATLLRSLQMPNEFAKAHWVIDYRFGFIKRGFIGSVLTILSRFGIISRNEYTVIWLSFIGVIILYAVFLFMTWRVFKQTNWNEYSYFILYILMSSPFVVTSGHFFGYLDSIIIIISFTCVWLIIYKKILFCSLLAIIAVLIHESFLVIGLPLIIFSMYMTRDNYDYPIRKMFYPVCA